MDENMQYSLLIVDDRASNILALANILKHEYAIYVSKNGRDALRVAVEKQPDVILLDVVMPDMNGYEVIAALKRDESTRAIPVIFITSLDSADDEEKGLALQAADYISKPFSPAIVKLRVRNQIQIVAQLRMIEKLSMTDQLTGTPNRRSFDTRLRLDWNRAVREQLPLSLLMVDIDYFKAYNDAYGHQQGDDALITVARSLSGALHRGTDFFARWGGEEFAVLLTGQSREEVLSLAERIREEAAAAVIPGIDGDGAHVTVSVGVHTRVPTTECRIADFVACADDALYAAKQAGRNCVIQVGQGKTVRP